MTVKRKQVFGRILQHRLESAKLFPNLGETGKAFTEYVPVSYTHLTLPTNREV